MNAKFLLKTCALLLATILPVPVSGTDVPDNPNVYIWDESGIVAVWNKDADDGTCWVCHPGDDMDFPQHPYSGKVVIPEEILGRKVVGIQRDAFKENVNITEIVISGTVREIANDAFAGCTGLKTLSFLAGPDSIHIGHMGVQAGALSGLPLDSLYVDRELDFNSTSKGPFENSGLRVIAFGPHVEKLTKEYTFSNIPALKRVVIPATFKKFGLNCFQYTKIEELVIESSDELLETGGWQSSTMWNPSNRPFSSCELKRIDIDRPVTGLGGTGNLEELRLGPNAGSLSFENCGKLVKADLACVDIPANAYKNCGSLQYLILQEGIHTIGSSAFQGCSSLETLRLPDSYIANGEPFNEGLFKSCKKLKKVENLKIPYLPNETFRYCEGLEEITFEAEVKKINRWVFNNCNSLRKVVVPATITEISLRTFFDCPSLEEFIFEDGEPFTAEEVFWNLPIKSVYFGREFHYSMSTSEYGGYCFSPFAQNRVGEKAEFGPLVKEIGLYFFKRCSTLHDVIIGPGVEIIKYQAFEACTSLKEINIPSNVKEICSSAFKNCSALKKVVFSDDLSPRSRDGASCLVRGNAFDGSRAITEVVVTCENMPDLVSGAFHDDVYAAAKLTVPEGMSADYMAHPEWGRFNTITENITTGIDMTVAPESDACDVFSLQGVELLRNADSAALGSLASGIYIVRSRAGIRKIVKK
mgnify:CR=1 FL=1